MCERLCSIAQVVLGQAHGRSRRSRDTTCEINDRMPRSSTFQLEPAMRPSSAATAHNVECQVNHAFVLPKWK